MTYYIQDLCCICLSISNEKCSESSSKYADNLTSIDKIKTVFLGLSSVMESDDKICMKCSETVGFVYEFHKTCLKNINIFSSYKKILKENQLKKQCGLSVDLNKSKTFNVNTLTSVEIKVEPPEEPLNNYITLYDANFVSTSRVVEIKEEIETNYDTCDGESEISQLNFEIKIEHEETGLERECMNETKEISEVESLKSNINDFQNVFVQSTDEVVDGEEVNRELIEDPLQVVAEEKLDVGRRFFEFININHSKGSEEKLIFVDKNVESDSNIQLIDSESNTHTRKEPYKCEFCGKSFIWLGQFNTHRLIHTDIKPHKCDICGKLFRRKHNLKQHMLVHTDEKPHKCNICGKIFRRKQELKLHIFVHTGEKHLRCDICGKLFGRTDHLNSHKLIHTDEKTHKCNICEKLFKTKVELKRHSVIHTGEKPHQCDICEKLFNDKANYLRHMFIHTGEKPHKCDICGQLFRRVYDLNSHKFIHTDEKPHKCDICGKSFTRKSTLKKHSEIHTGEKTD